MWFVYLVTGLEAAAPAHALPLALVIRYVSEKFVPFPSHGLPETCSERSCGIAIQSILVQFHLPRVFNSSEHLFGQLQH